MKARTGIEWDDAALEAARQRVAEDGVIEAGGVRLSSEQLAALLIAAPRDPMASERAILERADFRNATFCGNADFLKANFLDVRFHDATFSGKAWFIGATFSGDAVFENATFSGEARFSEATFSGDAVFENATFSGEAWFSKATFSGGPWFVGATFSREAGFNRATFKEAVFENATFGGKGGFYNATFSGKARFEGATFTEEAVFQEATFSGDAGFGGVTFSGDARFDGAMFERAQEFGPLQVFGGLWLDRAVFAQRVTIEAGARRASFARAAFRGGATLLLRWAELWLEDSEFAEPSLVAGLQPRLTPERRNAFVSWEQPGQEASWVSCSRETPPESFAPRLLSLRGARLARLVLSGVDLRACRLAGSHGLDQLGVEHCSFAQMPHGWRWIAWRPIRWTQRRMIAEEQHWREHRYGPSWNRSDGQKPDDPDETGSALLPWPPEEPVLLEAGVIASLYRELRKGREDKKDEPGAADFYYGEMEMRRHSAPLGERSMLWLYWLLSGYGLRASRAVLALALTVVAFALLFHWWGFQPHQGLRRALLFSIESTSGLFRVPEPKGFTLTAAGEVLQVILRLAAPLLFGLALLALRGRVKR